MFEYSEKMNGFIRYIQENSHKAYRRLIQNRTRYKGQHDGSLFCDELARGKVREHEPSILLLILLPQYLLWVCYPLY